MDQMMGNLTDGTGHFDRLLTPLSNCRATAHLPAMSNHEQLPSNRRNSREQLPSNCRATADRGLRATGATVPL
jgi:hypothetical protein